MVGRRIVMQHQFVKKTDRTPAKEMARARASASESRKMLSHRQLRTNALGNAEVKVEFEALSDEYAQLDEFLKVRAAHGLTQAQVAQNRHHAIGGRPDGVGQREALAFACHAFQVCRRVEMQVADNAGSERFLNLLKIGDNQPV
jgi:hypothetical protein